MPCFSKLLAAAACALCASTGAQALDELSPEFRALRIQVARALVKIEVINQDGSYALGSAVVVAPGKAVTNCHVTRKASRINALWGGLRYAVAAQSVDAGHDLCVVHAPRLEVAPVTIASETEQNPKAGQFTLAAGFVGGQGLQVAQGEVVALHSHDGGKVIQSTTAFTSGASGGGLFNTHGELIGILTFRLRGADAHYFSAPARWISPALLDPAKSTRIAPIDGVAFWQAQGPALPYFLQAAPLEAGKQWNELVQLTQRWSAAEPRNAEAWYMRGHAYTQLQRGESAVTALRKAVDLDPNYELAWYKLGLTHAGDCDSAELKRIAGVLARLDQPLHARLLQAAHPATENKTKSFVC